MPAGTSREYNTVITKCKEIFTKKVKDYGMSWRIMRATSVTDQIFIKAHRIRTIENKGTQKIDDDIAQEYIGLVNYCIIGLIQLSLAGGEDETISEKEADKGYDRAVQSARALMQNKNHDYGEAWRSMRISSLTDLILMKVMRIKQIEDNKGETQISEGIDANYLDIINYAVFALIRLDGSPSLLLD